jgi:N-acyl-phosphatidylethanolamine-hydrolysing phospholipase D
VADFDDAGPPAHHAPDGYFRNPWPGGAAHGPGDMLRWVRERRRRELAPTPARGSLGIGTPSVIRPRGTADDFTATWIGHSTALIQVGGQNVLTDPVFCERAFPVQWMGPRRVMPPGLTLEALPPLDIVFVSHNHYDHLDRHAVKWISRHHPGVTWVVPLGVGRYIRRWGAREVVELDWWESATVGAFRVVATPARHFSARGFRDRNKSLWSGFAFEVQGKRTWYAGDTAYHPEFTRIGEVCGPFDLVMIPIGAYEPRWFMQIVHVNPEEAVQVYREVIAPFPRAPLPLMLGLHWGTFRLTDEPMDEPPIRTVQAWITSGLDARRLWIAKFGETRWVAASY